MAPKKKGDENRSKKRVDLEDKPQKKVNTDLEDQPKKKVDIDLNAELEEKPEKDTEKVFQGVEWTIENLSCWDKDIHTTSIPSKMTRIFPELTIELFPRGLHGEDKNVAVKICGKVPSYIHGRLSFYDSKGYLLCNHEMEKKKVPRKETKCFIGPAYQEVVGQVFSRSNKGRLTVKVWNAMSPEENKADKSARCPESLTVREGYNIMQYMRTTIAEYDVPLTLPPSVFGRLGNTITEIARIGYYVDENVPKELILSASEKDGRISLSVRPLELVGKILVHTRLSVVIPDACGNPELNKHLFDVQRSWTFSESLTKEVVKKEGFSLNLRFKIIPSIATNDCIEILTGFSTYLKGNPLM